MGVLGFIAGVLLTVMGFGRWRETGSPWWLAGSIALLVIVVVGALGGRNKA